MQGYYFSRPIPADEFEQKLISSRTESSENLSNNGITDVAELMDSVMSNPLFFNLMGAAAIAESDGSNLEALMINDSFFEKNISPISGIWTGTISLSEIETER